jgi:sugar lactone lactonase YvrE
MQLQRSFLLRAALTLAAAMAFSVAWAANVLIVNGASSATGPQIADTAAATTNLQAQLVSAGHTVTVSDGVPADISSYDEIWDIGFFPTLTGPIQSQYLGHLKLGKRLVVTGENNSPAFVARKDSILAFISAAGVGSLAFRAPTGDDVPNDGGGSDSIENVLPGFTSPNSIPNGQVIFAAPGGVTTAGSGVFLTRRPDGTSGAGIIYGKLITIFDSNFLQNDTTIFSGSSQPFLQNLIAPSPTASKIVNGLGRPFSVAISTGSAYVADTAGQMVWKVDLATGQRTAVAGTGEQGYNGDGIDAQQAQLDTPSGVAVTADAAGIATVYIADTGNHVIRKVVNPGTPGALIITVAGVPTSYAVGESTDPQCAASTPPATCAPATGLRLFGPRAVAVDGSGNVYIADRMNQQIKKLYTSGPLTGYIFAIAGVAGFPGANDGPITGAGAAHLNSPVGLALDVNGTVYVADEGNNKIRVVNQANSDSSGSVGTLAVFGANLLRPTGVAVRGNGDILIANYGRHLILDRSCSECVTTVAGTGTPGSGGIAGGPATAMQLNSPIGIAVDGDTLYIADMLNGRIVAVTLLPTGPIIQ